MDNFRKIAPSEANACLKMLHETGGTVLVKFPDSGVLKFKADFEGRGQDTIVGARPATLAKGRRGQIATCNFSLSGLSYFFTARVDLQKKTVTLVISGGLHRLVRQRSGRLKIPPNMAVNLVTSRVGNKALVLRGPLQDISDKGCKVAFHAEDMKLLRGEPVVGTIRFEARLPLKVTGEVRYHRQMARGHFNQVLGLEFDEIEDKDRFEKLLLDLQREIYARSRG